MDYYINPSAALSGAFTVPSCVVDSYFKLSKPEHIKILLFILRNMADIPEEELIAKECSVSEYEVKEALLYWADAGILLPKEAAAPSKPREKRAAVGRNEKPTRSDILQRSMADSKIQYLLTEAQKKFARNLKDNEARTLVWLYDDQGMDISLIILVLQYAALKGKMNIRFIETLALELIDKEIDNIADADAELHKKDMGEKAWQAVCAAFGLEKRKPSQKELETSVKWINTWGISRELLECAYDLCVNQKSKFSFPYVSKIIENWHTEGVKKPEDIKNPPKKTQKEDFVSYDIDLYEKMLNSKD